MIERDYILNLFAILGKAIAKLALLKEQKKYEDALHETDEASLSILGLHIEMLATVPMETVRNLFGSDRALVDPKLYIAGRLLRERGEILERQGRKEDADADYMKSLHFLVAYLPAANVSEDRRLVESVDFLVEKLNEYDLQISIKRQLILYNENLGRYSKSEDLIFEIVGEDPAFLGEAISLYQRILLKPDGDLDAGNLPRAEVEESLSELERRPN